MDLVRLGEFETDLETGELFKQGQKVPLEMKPFQLLATLLERPGQIVTRDDLRRKIWPPGTYVDFDRCVNIAVTKLRHALSDSSDSPRYIETLPKRGYRLIAPVEDRGQNRRSNSQNAEGANNRKIRVAILPFEALCDAEEQKVFGERLIDEIVSQIGHSFPEHIGLLARTGNLKYNTTTKSMAQIGRELKVDHVLTGIARASGERVLLTVQLTSTSSQALTWSETYERTPGDISSVRSELAAKITRFLGLKVLSAVAELPLPNKDAHLEYLRGKHLHFRGTAAAYWKSIQHFERAIELDPGYAPAHSALANARAALGGAVVGTGLPRDFYQRAKESALTAIELNNKLPDCHVSLAIIKFFYEWDWVAAERSLLRALELEPSNSLAHQIYSRLLSSVLRHEAALETAKRLCELEPLSPQAHFLLGKALYFVRDYEGALEELKSALEMDELHGPALLAAAHVFSQLSMHQEAISHAERAHTLYPDRNDILASAGEIYARAGQAGAAQMTLSKLKAAAKRGYVSPFDFGVVANAIRKKDLALEYFHEAYDEGSPLLIQLLPEDPRFDTLRDYSKYNELISRIRGTNRAPLTQSMSLLGA